jgi:hypothetical protein
MNAREYYQRKARQCRRLAESIGDNLTQTRLVTLAEEFDTKAELAIARDALDAARQNSVKLLGNGLPSHP